MQPVPRLSIICLAILLLHCDGASNDFRSTAGSLPDTSSESGEELALGKSQVSSVTIDSGVLVGGRNTYGSNYLGIPYASPPIGNNRFRAPQPVAPWLGSRDATRAGNPCLQNPSQGGYGNEDCLYLNVWTPPRESSSPLPVMVWIHGGAFDNGSGIGALEGNELYTGEKLASLGNVIIVTMNYRLGALGSLYHPAVKKAYGQAGNFGILDQIEALSWVQRNIHAFGGDASNVTIFGESAGAMSTCTHVAQSYRKGQFKRAIMQSGNCQAVDRKDAEEAAIAFAEQIGCGGLSDEATLSCLQSVPAQKFAEVQTNMELAQYASDLNYRLPYAPVIDGLLFDKQPIDVIASGQHQKVDMIIGSNVNEIPGAVFARVNSKEAALAIIAESGVDEVVAEDLYETYDTGLEPRDVLGRIATDIQFTCPGRQLTELIGTKKKVYNYRFDLLYGFHGSELPYVFQKLAPSSPNMREMGQFWTSFARSGMPSKSWAAHTNGKTTHLIIGEQLRQVKDYRKDECAQILRSGLVVQ